MGRRFWPQHGLRSRLILLAAAPSLLCLLVVALAVSWLVRDLHRDIADRTLQAAAARLEGRLSEMQGRLNGLARLLPHDETLADALAAALATGRPLDPGLLRRTALSLQAAEPAMAALEVRIARPGHEDRLDRYAPWCEAAAPLACAEPDLPALHGAADLLLSGGALATIRLTALLDHAVAEDLVAADRGALVVVTDGQVRLSTLPVPRDRIASWGPAWLLTALAEDRAAAGPLRADGRNWLAHAVPLPAGRPEGRTVVLLLLPSAPRAMAVEETLEIAAPAIALILALCIACAAGAARRLGGMLTALTDALRRLGRGDLNVPIPAPPAGAPREVIALTDACVLFRDASAERSRMSERLRWLANFDSLTGLPNRALLADRLDLAVAAARREGSALAVLAMDLDHFKEVNDGLGQAAGDEVLRVVAARLRDCLRATDTLARIGADEFVLVAPDLAEPEHLSAFAARLLAAMEEPVPLGAEFRTVGLSVGATLLAPGGFDGRPEALLQEADLALHHAKADGGGCLRVFDPAMDERLRTRRALVSDLRHAMARGELTILFQPQISIATRRIKGAEALLRWHHPTRGLVGPDTFIPLAEETGLIVPIGAWVLEEACRVARGWDGLTLAVNVSALQVGQASFVATVEGALARSGLPPERLELEITEAAMLANSAETLGILSRLRGLGVRLAMDDFGTGYSSLATLQRFRFDKIKVDRSFIRHVAQDPRAVALLRAVIALGSALGAVTNAEGVEEEGQLSMLRSEGCEEAQGYLFGRPMSAAEFQARAMQEDSCAA